MSLIGVLLFLLALMLAIFLHEGGHFATAKLFGMKVERFFLGFGKTLWSFRRGETEYGIKLLPFGGFCKIAGMSPHEFDGNFLEQERGQKPEPVEPERQFRNKPAWQRAIVLAAGSVTHFLMALVLIYALIVVIGLQIGPPTTKIQTTVATTSDGKPAPAAAAGLRSGDRIVAIDGQPISTFDQLRAVLSDKAGQRVSITYNRDGRDITTTLVPAVEKDSSGQTRGFLGISPAGAVVHRNPIEGVAATGGMFRDLVVGSFKGLGGLIPGLADRLQAPAQTSNGGGGGGGGGGESAPVGLIGIGRLAGQAVSAGQWSMFVALLIEFNVFVGIFNLLPIPILDGGYLALIGWQAITRREVDLRKLAPIAAVAVSLLVVFVLVVVWLDITNPIANPFR
jgi:membrane-associated protease RseP (regulator of RpoE activity)